MDSGASAGVRVLGIDPAPKKPTAVWSADGCQRVPAGQVREFLAEHLQPHSGLLVAWDSPLAFDPAEGFSDRPFDRAARAWVAKNVREGRIQQGAVSVRPFSGCPHWVHSCHVLGLPFGERIAGLAPYSAPLEKPEPGRGLVMETHPAVALAALWIELELEEPFPRYKGSKATAGVPAAIAERLGFPEEAGVDDDALDAFMAYRLGAQFLNRESRFIGDPGTGGYLLPDNGPASEIQTFVVR